MPHVLWHFPIIPSPVWAIESTLPAPFQCFFPWSPVVSSHTCFDQLRSPSSPQQISSALSVCSSLLSGTLPMNSGCLGLLKFSTLFPLRKTPGFGLGSSSLCCGLEISFVSFLSKTRVLSYLLFNVWRNFFLFFSYILSIFQLFLLLSSLFPYLGKSLSGLDFTVLNYSV